MRRCACHDAGTPPLLSLLLSPSLLRILRSRGPEFEVFARSPLSGVSERAHTRERCHPATVDYTPQLAAANHCTTCSSVCCTLLAELLISTSSTSAPRAIPLAEHSVSEASLASCWLERPPIGVCLSV